MEPVSVLSVLIGILIIVTRGPMVFAPTATLRVLRKLVSTDRRVRGLALAVAPLALALVALPLGEGGLAAILRIFGWLWGSAAIWLLVTPGSYRSVVRVVLDFFERSGETTVRAMGIVAVGLGVALIYFGVR